MPAIAISTSVISLEVLLPGLDIEERVGLRTAEKEQAVGIADEKALQEIKTQAKETAERDMAVELVKNVRAAEINRSVEVVKAEEDKQTIVIRAEGQRQQEVIDAEATKQKTIIVAEGDLQDSLKEAEGILAIGTSTSRSQAAGGNGNGFTADCTGRRNRQQ